ncbi:hypothetical protein HBI24_091370 [Parastagonospora nodorum]|nr:hypothetical protein HBI09_076410 [Parastagonospora nodorum]KAH4051882.1 hypothetical protein HBH49_109210 [Parastagonospora nodorum]KAH4126761.1 hypothetical protein HBH47_047800 [Parastagonospora nodorum]KAH4167134.1 hypothetical protein HBH43_133660 [Parastagonospora nodorum]KAH5015742.1 hypothetical protein HBI77_061420 [Parastagonospora nodorum]
MRHLGSDARRRTPQHHSEKSLQFRETLTMAEYQALDLNTITEMSRNYGCQRTPKGVRTSYGQNINNFQSSASPESNITPPAPE